jgi:hypothetical protein
VLETCLQLALLELPTKVLLAATQTVQHFMEAVAEQAV